MLCRSIPDMNSNMICLYYDTIHRCNMSISIFNDELKKGNIDDMFLFQIIGNRDMLFQSIKFIKYGSDIHNIVISNIVIGLEKILTVLTKINGIAYHNLFNHEKEEWDNNKLIYEYRKVITSFNFMNLPYMRGYPYTL